MSAQRNEGPQWLPLAAGLARAMQHHPPFAQASPLDMVGASQWVWTIASEDSLTAANDPA